MRPITLFQRGLLLLASTIAIESAISQSTTGQNSCDNQRRCPELTDEGKAKILEQWFPLEPREGNGELFTKAASRPGVVAQLKWAFARDLLSKGLRNECRTPTADSRGSCDAVLALGTACFNNLPQPQDSNRGLDQLDLNTLRARYLGHHWMMDCQANTSCWQGICRTQADIEDQIARVGDLEEACKQSLISELRKGPGSIDPTRWDISTLQKASSHFLTSAGRLRAEPPPPNPFTGLYGCDPKATQTATERYFRIGRQSESFVNHPFAKKAPAKNAPLSSQANALIIAPDPSPSIAIPHTKSQALAVAAPTPTIFHDEPSKLPISSGAKENSAKSVEPFAPPALPSIGPRALALLQKNGVCEIHWIESSAPAKGVPSNVPLPHLLSSLNEPQPAWTLSPRSLAEIFRDESQSGELKRKATISQRAYDDMVSSANKATDEKTKRIRNERAHEAWLEYAADERHRKRYEWYSEVFSRSSRPVDKVTRFPENAEAPPLFHPGFHVRVREFAPIFLSKSSQEQHDYLKGINDAHLSQVLAGLTWMIGERPIPHFSLAESSQMRSSLNLRKTEITELTRLKDVFERAQARLIYDNPKSDRFARLLAEAHLRCLGKSTTEAPNLARLGLSDFSTPKDPNADLARALRGHPPDAKAYFWAAYVFEKEREDSVGFQLTKRMDDLLAKDPRDLTPQEKETYDAVTKDLNAFIRSEHIAFATANIPKSKGSQTPMGLKERSALAPWLYIEDPWRNGYDQSFVPKVVFSDDGSAKFKFVPTQELKELQMRQAIVRGMAHNLVGSTFKRDPRYDQFVFPTTDEEAMEWHAKFGAATPDRIKTWIHENPIRSETGVVGDVAFAAAAWLVAASPTTGAAAATGVGAVLLVKSALRSLLGRTAVSVGIGYGATYIGDRYGATAALALVPLQILGQWGIGRLAASPRLRHFVADQVDRLSFNTAEREVIRAGRRVGLTTEQSLERGAAIREALQREAEAARAAGTATTLDEVTLQGLANLPLENVRIASAERLLNIQLTPAQRTALLNAHLAQNNITKGRFLLEHFDNRQARALMENWIAGTPNSIQITASLAQAAIHQRPALPSLPRASRLHENISNSERASIIGNIPLGSVMSAPGHALLRNPQSVVQLAQHIRVTPPAGLAAWMAEPMVVNVVTRTENGIVRVVGVELLDGNHRFAAGLLSGNWRTIGDIPDGLLQVRVNGHLAGGGGVPARWIPADVAMRSEIRGWTVVSSPFARGPTASIPADIPSWSHLFAMQDRGIPLSEVLRLTIARNAGP